MCVQKVPQVTIVVVITYPIISCSTERQRKHEKGEPKNTSLVRALSKRKNKCAMRIRGKQTQPSLQSEAVTFVKLDKQEQYQTK